MVGSCLYEGIIFYLKLNEHLTNLFDLAIQGLCLGGIFIVFILLGSWLIPATVLNLQFASLFVKFTQPEL